MAGRPGHRPFQGRQAEGCTTVDSMTEKGTFLEGKEMGSSKTVIGSGKLSKDGREGKPEGEPATHCQALNGSVILKTMDVDLRTDKV